MKRQILAIAIFISLTGCSSFTTGRYSVATENVMTLRDAKMKSLSVGGFTSSIPDQKELSCRGIYPIRTSDGENYSEVIRKAFIDELRMAGKYSSTSALSITGNIESLDFSSTSGYMNLSVTIKMSNGSSVSVSDSYPFPTGLWSDENACGQAAQAFIPTVQNVIGKAIRSSQFIDFSSLK
jgi:hypothetical protein